MPFIVIEHSKIAGTNRKIVCLASFITSHRQLDKLLYSRYSFCKTGRKTMLELQCPVRKSKQFGGRSKQKAIHDPNDSFGCVYGFFRC